MFQSFGQIIIEVLIINSCEPTLTGKEAFQIGPMFLLSNPSRDLAESICRFAGESDIWMA